MLRVGGLLRGVFPGAGQIDLMTYLLVVPMLVAVTLARGVDTGAPCRAHRSAGGFEAGMSSDGAPACLAFATRSAR